jgi:short-chain fatty acids transporter
MLSRLGLILSSAFRRTAPDPFVIAILLTIVTAILALTVGSFDPDSPSRLVALLDAWRIDAGLWKFLAFGMQMCLILVTGHALACTRPVRSAIDALADLPHSTAQAAALVGFVAAVTGVINWGLGLIVGALLARDVGRSMHRRGIPAHYPLLCAAGYIGLLVWHGGLSGSAPLSMTTAAGAAKVLPADQLAQLGTAGIPLSQTILSPMNLFVTGGLLLIVPVILAMLAPRRVEHMLPIDQCASDLLATDFTEPIASPQPGKTRTLPDWLDKSFVVSWLLAIPLLIAFVRYGYVTGGAADVTGIEKYAATLRGFNNLGLNEINMFMLALGLILHGSPVAYMNAVTDGARGCAGIIVQFPLYAGIMAMMAASQLVLKCSHWFTDIGNTTTVPVLSFCSAGIVNLFVPSGGGQWGIQGPVALAAGHDAGVATGKMIMSVAYGDELTNMLQPFWALPLLAITGVKARDIVGYTAVVMCAAGLWMLLGLFIF